MSDLELGVLTLDPKALSQAGLQNPSDFDQVPYQTKATWVGRLFAASS